MTAQLRYMPPSWAGLHNTAYFDFISAVEFECCRKICHIFNPSLRSERYFVIFHNTNKINIPAQRLGCKFEIGKGLRLRHEGRKTDNCGYVKDFFHGRKMFILMFYHYLLHDRYFVHPIKNMQKVRAIIQS